jgi:hypothetical protein
LLDFSFTLQSLPLPPNFASSSKNFDDAFPIATEGGGGMAATAAAAAFGEMDRNEFEFGQSTELRGSLEWAPPRAQLIIKVKQKDR